jgi:predicted ATPase/DNA-binding SARP family transcriptional activator/NTP pyrophosphatase (non-canonical NTP hydrolase)
LEIRSLSEVFPPLSWIREGRTMPRLTLMLLGPPLLDRDGEPVHLRSRKCLALLAYLAVTGRTHRRDSLASLFWPESDARRAQHSLRNTLSLVRRALNGAWFVVDRETIALDGSEREAVDVVRFRDLVARCQRHGHSVRETCAECLPLLEEAVELCRGHFMAGFTLPDSPEFDDWQTREGEALQRELAEALERLVEGYTVQGDMERVMAHAQRWVGLDPLEEGAHRALMRLYARSGRQSAALRQYDACQQVLREELGVSPSAETRDLYEAIRGGRMPPAQVRAPMVSAVPTRPHHNLPVQPTAFVGREEALDHVAQRLADPACRLLTVVGPGGMGKSRLAIQAGQEHIPVFGDGVWFVPLAPLDSVDLLASTIMEALQVPQYGSMDPRVQLLNYVRDRNLLLILDNFEHLLEGTTLVTRMLEEAPGLKLLVTSREWLDLREEWLLPLEGMEFPDEGEIARAGETTDVEDSILALEDYSAIELFVQAARRVRPDFSLAKAGASSVARICRLVEGMPLAIELAIPWIRAMSCEDIAQEIERDIGFLATSRRDMPSRHRSMRAVFDRSWQQLSDRESDVLRKLSVFRGGFRREAAEAVAGASLGVLSTLVDRSWVRTTPSGRYEMHELIRQYAAERLRAGEPDAEQICDLHSAYYATFLYEREATIQQRETMAEAMEEIDNVRAAWDWAVDRRSVETVSKCVLSYWTICAEHGWYHEVVQAFDRAAPRLREQLDVLQRCHGLPLPEEGWIALPGILSLNAELHKRMGLLGRARALAEESLASVRRVEPSMRQKAVHSWATLTLGGILHTGGEYSRAGQLFREAHAQSEQIGDRAGVGHAAFFLGLNASRLGKWEDAEELLEQACSAADEMGREVPRGIYSGHLSSVLRARGEYERAGQLAQEWLHINQALGLDMHKAGPLEELGEVAAALGEYKLARQHYQESLAIAEEIGDRYWEVVSLNGLGGVALAQEEHAEARRWFEQSLAAARETGNRWQSLVALIGLGNANCALGETQQSRQLLCQALEEAMETGSMPEAVDALVGLAYLSVKREEPERAAGLLIVALHHPATTRMTKDRAQNLLSRLESDLPPEAFAEAVERGRARELEKVVAETLRSEESGE